MTDTAYLEQVYAGIIGKTAGVRLGAPVEPTVWGYERIHACFGHTLFGTISVVEFSTDGT